MLITVSGIPGCGGRAPSQRAVADMELTTIDDGEQAISEGRFREAVDIFSKLVVETPNDPVLRYYLGLAKDNSGDEPGAIMEYKKALALNPDLADARMNLGLVYFNQGDVTAAIAEFETVAEAEPEAADVQFNLAMALAAAGKVDDARAHYEKCAGLDPEDPDPIVAMGNLEKDAGHLDAALLLYEKAETMGQGSAVAVISAAQILKEQNRIDAAVKKLMSLGEMQANAETLASAGLMLAKMNKADEAIAIYRHALDLDSQATAVALLLGNALARKGDFAEAAKQFQNILDTAPDAPEAAAAQKGLSACRAKLGQ